MKALALYSLLFILFLKKYSSELCGSIHEPQNSSQCINAEKGENETKCCYVFIDYDNSTYSTGDNNKTDNVTFCKAYNKTGYEEMRYTFRDEIKELNESQEIKYAIIDCGGGKNIFVSVLSLLFILI